MFSFFKDGKGCWSSTRLIVFITTITFLSILCYIVFTDRMETLKEIGVILIGAIVAMHGGKIIQSKFEHSDKEPSKFL